jgi:hypothetical protein
MNYLATFLVGLVVLMISSLIMIKMIKDRKKHKGSCGCGCSNCPSADMCHPK